MVFIVIIDKKKTNNIIFSIKIDKMHFQNIFIKSMNSFYRQKKNHNVNDKKLVVF